MVTDSNGLGEFCFAAEGMAGSAGASALRKVRSLAEAEPTGRLFGAIATLSELSRQSEAHLRAADAAISASSNGQAVRHIAKALSAMSEMTAKPGETLDIPEVISEAGRIRR